jgi:hypothetical protein
MAEASTAAFRAANQEARVPEGAQCLDCGTTTRALLKAVESGWRCYECGNRAHGRSATELHHVLSRAVSDVTIEVPGNMHRQLSEQQRAIPKEVSEAAPRDPLSFVLMVLYAIHGFALVMVNFLDAAIAWLQKHLAWLIETGGPEWYTKHPSVYGIPLA